MNTGLSAHHEQIMDYNYDLKDVITHNIINAYKEYIVKEDIDFVYLDKLDKIIYKYITDKKLFKRINLDELLNTEFSMERVFDIYETFEEQTALQVTIARWL